MTYISLGGSSRVRLLAVAGVLALHVLLWFGFTLKRPVTGPADVHVTYADLRLIEPRKPAVPAAAAEPPPTAAVRPAAPRAAARRPAAPIQLHPAEPASEVAAAPDEAPAQSDLVPPAPQGQAIDVEALRSAARDYERTREKSPIEKHRAQLREEQRRDVAAEAIAKSARGDCRNAYSGLGLLALIPLAVDAVRDGGCKW